LGEPGNWLQHWQLPLYQLVIGCWIRKSAFLQYSGMHGEYHLQAIEEKRATSILSGAFSTNGENARIEKEPNGHTTTLQLSGRIQSANIGDIQAQMDDEHVRIFMDLGEVTLVDVEVVRFLSECEDGGIVLVHCPPYVREWILRERAEGA
jgi:hypothetical protein